MGCLGLKNLVAEVALEGDERFRQDFHWQDERPHHGEHQDGQEDQDNHDDHNGHLHHQHGDETAF